MSQLPFNSPAGNLNVTECYRIWASQYDTLDNPLVAMSGHVLDQYASEFKDKTVFEFGCGTGRNLKQLLNYGAQCVTGIDVSQDMLNYAHKTTEGKATLILGDIQEEARNQKDHFHFFLICLVLEHIKDLDAVFKAATTLVNQGDQLIILEIHPWLRAQGIRAHCTHKGKDFFPPSYPHTEGDIIETAKAYGWLPKWSRTWYGHANHMINSPKLERMKGLPIILDLRLHRCPEK